MCGCNKNKKTPSRSTSISAKLQSVRANRASIENQQIVQSQAMPVEPELNSGLTASRRAIELKRRQAILAKLGRI